MRPKRPGPLGDVEDVALKALARRDHSREEMQSKLLAQGFSPEVVAVALKHLEERGLIQDSRYASRIASFWAKEKLWGPQRIQQRLSAKGFSEEVIQEAMEKAEETLATRARVQRLLGQKWANQRLDQFSPRQKKKLIQYLHQRGYLWEHVVDALPEAGGWEEK